MKVRFKDRPAITGTASEFNVHALAEIIFYFDDADTHGGCDSVFMRDVEIFVTKLDTWKSFNDASRDGDIIPDNYNRSFGEPETDADRERGYSL